MEPYPTVTPQYFRNLVVAFLAFLKSVPLSIVAIWGDMIKNDTPRRQVVVFNLLKIFRVSQPEEMKILVK